MAKPYNVTISTTASRAIAYSKNRTSLALSNLGTGTVYIGSDAEVNSANGYPILSTQTVVFSPLTGDDPRLERWLVCAADTQDVRVLEEYAEPAEA